MVDNGDRITSAIELDKSREVCAASKDSKNDASSGLSTAVTCTWMIITRQLVITHVKDMSKIFKITFYQHKYPSL